MRLLIQRVLRAQVTVAGQVVGKIGAGALVFVGIHKNDTQEKANWLANKLVHLRFFADSAGKMNLSLLETNGSLLIVSQFTLYGNCSEGRRPDFFDSAPPDVAKPLYDHFINEVKKSIPALQTGTFGAMMDVDLTNDGPITLLLER
jgi:D-tyrosyl-tRNA(Tyr) deacylase